MVVDAQSLCRPLLVVPPSSLFWVFGALGLDFGVQVVVGNVLKMGLGFPFGQCRRWCKSIPPPTAGECTRRTDRRHRASENDGQAGKAALPRSRSCRGDQVLGPPGSWIPSANRYSRQRARPTPDDGRSRAVAGRRSVGTNQVEAAGNKYRVQANGSVRHVLQREGRHPDCISAIKLGARCFAKRPVKVVCREWAPPCHVPCLPATGPSLLTAASAIW